MSRGLTVSDESDAAVAGGGGGGGGGEVTVQPESVTLTGVAEPSLTSTVQSAGLANGSRSILKLPAPSLVPRATPSTVIVRFGIAVPSSRSLDPLSSARETRTSASAAEAATMPAIKASTAARAILFAVFRLVFGPSIDLYARGRRADCSFSHERTRRNWRRRSLPLIGSEGWRSMRYGPRASTT